MSQDIWEDFGNQYSQMYKEVEFDLVHGSTALLVVDVQRKSCDRDIDSGVGAALKKTYPELAARFFDRLDVTLPNIRRLVDFFRAHQLPVVFFAVGPALPDGSDMPATFRQQYANLNSAGDTDVKVTRDSRGYELIDGLEPRPNELLIHKVTRSVFCATPTELALRSMGIRTLVIVGGSTQTCVASSARHGSDLGFEVVLVEDACHSVFPELHGSVMTTHRMGQGRVMSTADVESELSGSTCHR